MEKYSGNFQPDFQLNHLAHNTLAWYGREVMLANHIHDRALGALVTIAYGAEAQTKVACDEWMGCSPIYNRRNRALLNIHGDDVNAICKAFQVDIGAPHTFLNFHWQVNNPREAFFWLTDCGAYNYVRLITKASPEAETQICHHMEDPTFDATVLAVNQAARCRPVFRPPHTEVPKEGPCRWRIFIDDSLVLPEVNPTTAIVAASKAAQFKFQKITLQGDGMPNYSGEFKRDFRLEDLDHALLELQCKEFQLNVNLQMRAAYTSIQQDYGLTVAQDIAQQEWPIIAPVYVARLRKCLGIEGNDMHAILKLLQNDPFLPQEYLINGGFIEDSNTGYFWLEDCEAWHDNAPHALLDTLRNEQNPGLVAPLQAVNPQAQVNVISVNECEKSVGKSMHGKKIVQAWRITIDAQAEPVEAPSLASIIAGNDLYTHDCSVHHYHY